MCPASSAPRFPLFMRGCAAGRETCAISILAHRNRAPNSPGIVLEMNGRDVFCISKKAASFSWQEDVRYNLGGEKIALNDFFKQSARFFPTFLLRAKILQHFFFPPFSYPIANLSVACVSAASSTFHSDGSFSSPH